MKNILAAFFLISFIFGGTAFAQEDGYVCAAVYPCDDNGNLLEEYENIDSPCLDYYIGQCLSAKLQIAKNNVQACEFQKADLESAIESKEATERKYLKLKRKLKSLRAGR